jgi:hypothetical protein
MTDKRHPQDPLHPVHDEQLTRCSHKREKAPPGLTRRLHRIPAEEGYGGLAEVAAVHGGPRWVPVPAFAAALLAVVARRFRSRLAAAAVAGQVLQAARSCPAFKHIDKQGSSAGDRRRWVMN